MTTNPGSASSPRSTWRRRTALVVPGLLVTSVPAYPFRSTLFPSAPDLARQACDDYFHAGIGDPYVITSDAGSTPAQGAGAQGAGVLGIADARPTDLNYRIQPWLERVAGIAGIAYGIRPGLDPVGRGTAGRCEGRHVTACGWTSGTDRRE
ncbi:hypothetical protein ACWEOW_23735 [Monashia sp. NPDC004114]